MIVGIFFVFGLLVGSFINVCIYRLPRDESIVFPNSQCPLCKKGIRPWHNIPLFGFLLLWGKCYDCHAPIPWRYPLVELMHGVGFAYTYSRFGLSPESGIALVFFSAMMAVIFIDLSHQIIPDVITLPGMVLGLIASATILPLGWLDSLLGLLVGGGLFYGVALLSLALLKKEGMGGGDIKLVAMIGAFLGWQAVLLTIFIAAVSGSIIGITMIVFGRRGRADMIPFGPYLVLGGLTALFWGGGILQWYFSLGAA